jgi:hypothetical protein
MNLNTLLPEIFINANAETAVIMHYLRRGAIDFFTESEAWRVEIESDVDAGVKSFTLNVGTDADYLKMVSVEVADKALTPVTLDDLAGGSSPSKYFVNVLGKVTLNAHYTQDVTVKSVVSVVPSGDVVDDGLLTQYRDAIVSACLAKLLLVPKKPWTDAGLAQYHANKWQMEAAKAKRHAFAGASRAPLRSSMWTINGR